MNRERLKLILKDTLKGAVYVGGLAGLPMMFIYALVLNNLYFLIPPVLALCWFAGWCVRTDVEFNREP